MTSQLAIATCIPGPFAAVANLPAFDDIDHVVIGHILVTVVIIVVGFVHVATGCNAADAIGRGAMLDPWIFRRIQGLASGETNEYEPTVDEQIGFLSSHFSLMARQYDDFACLMFRKFAAWYGSRLGIPEDLEDRLRRFESFAEFDEILNQIRFRHGERMCSVPTALVKTPNGPVEHW